MSANDEKLKRLSAALDDHSAEGIEILYSEPSSMISATIVLMLLIVVAALVWSFFGRADVIVSAPGVLGPEDEVRRVYSPIDGELVDIYVTEGAPVSKGDLLARLNARDAIQVAANARGCRAGAQGGGTGIRGLSGAPRAHEAARADPAGTDRDRRTPARQAGHRGPGEAGAGAESQAGGSARHAGKGRPERAMPPNANGKSCSACLRCPGGGGISKNKVEEARDAYFASETDYKLAEAKLGELEFQLSEEYAKAKADLDSSDQKLVELRIEYEKALNDIKQEEYRIELKYRSAKLAAEAADAYHVRQHRRRKLPAHPGAGLGRGHLRGIDPDG